jgi:hypothetical protein
MHRFRNLSLPPEMNIPHMMNVPSAFRSLISWASTVDSNVQGMPIIEHTTHRVANPIR